MPHILRVCLELFKVIRMFYHKSSNSDLGRGRVQALAVELFQNAEFLNSHLSSFFEDAVEDEYVSDVMTIIQSQPKKARINTISMVKLFMEIQVLYRKIMANPNKEFSPEELGEIVTKILAFRAQYKALAVKLDSTVDDLIQVLNDHGITLPKQ